MYINFTFHIPEDGHMAGPKHVGIHSVYKLISIYLCAFAGTIIVYIQIKNESWIT